MKDRVLLQFASCNRQNLPQHFWSRLADVNADAFLWTGDAAYAEDNSVAAQGRALEEAKSGPEYARFAAGIATYGSWDDHDFGVNDGGRFVGGKNQRQANFLTFLGLQDDPVVSRRDGVYYSRDFTSDSGVTTRVLFLDTRSHRDNHIVRSIGEFHFPFTALMSAFIRLATTTLGIGERHDGDVLGREQWRWLEATLAESKADVHVIVSSIQVSTSNPIVESWGHFPVARDKLFALLQRHDPSGLLLLSGDVHHGEVSSIDFTRANGENGSWFEITSSGLTHNCRTGVLTDLICPLMLDGFSRHRPVRSNYLMERNFGLLSVSSCDPPTSSCRAEVNATVFSLDSSHRLEQIIVVKTNNSDNPIVKVRATSFPTVLGMALERTGNFTETMVPTLIVSFFLLLFIYGGFASKNIGRGVANSRK